MCKKITFILFFISLFGFSQNPIRNINFSKSALNVQDVGKPYKFDLTFDLIGFSKPPKQTGVALFYYFITEVGDNSSFGNWPVSGYQLATNYQTIPNNGYRVSFEQIQLKDKFPNYPSGKYKVLIMLWRGGNNWIFFGGYQNHFNNNTFNFDFNDFCSDCGDGIYYGKDSDGDGVQDHEDNCPNESGPASNNGCPNKHPKFYLTKATIKQDGKTWDFFKNEVPVIESSLYPSDFSETNFNFTISNTGGTASKANWSFFIADKNKLGTGSIKIHKLFHRNPMTIAAGKEKTISLNEKILGRLWNGNISFNLLPSKTYYFHVFFEGSEMGAYNSWKYVFPFKVKRVDFSSKSLSSSFLRSTSFRASILETENYQKLEPYKISFYNLSGLKVMTKEVYSIEEENATSLLLPKGIYIIKSKNGDRKVYVD